MYTNIYIKLLLCIEIEIHMFSTTHIDILIHIIYLVNMSTCSKESEIMWLKLITENEYNVATTTKKQNILNLIFPIYHNYSTANIFSI